jgi:hypothetical protein
MMLVIPPVTRRLNRAMIDIYNDLRAPAFSAVSVRQTVTGAGKSGENIFLSIDNLIVIFLQLTYVEHEQSILSIYPVWCQTWQLLDPQSAMNEVNRAKQRYDV